MSQMMSSQVIKASDVAMVCYLDLCKAAIYVPPTITVTDGSLRTLAPEMADELKVLHLAVHFHIVRMFIGSHYLAASNYGLASRILGIASPY